MRPYRILFFVDTLGGGVTRVVVNLIRHLDPALFRASMAVVRHREGHLVDVPEEVPVHIFDKRHVRQTTFGLARLLRQTRPALLLSAQDHLNVVALLARRLEDSGNRLLDFARDPDLSNRALETGQLERDVVLPGDQRLGDRRGRTDQTAVHECERPAGLGLDLDRSPAAAVDRLPGLFPDRQHLAGLELGVDHEPGTPDSTGRRPEAGMGTRPRSVHRPRSVSIPWRDRPNRARLLRPMSHNLSQTPP